MNQQIRFLYSSFTALLLSVSSLMAEASDKPAVLYLYGDVSAHGKVPSGNEKPFHQMRLNDEGRRGMSQFKEAIEEVGFDIREAYDAETTLDTKTLAPLSVLILGSNQRRFTPEERAAVEQWVKDGGGIIAWSDSAFGGHFRHVGVDNPTGRISNNDITEPFGMYFMTDNGAGNYLVTEYEKDHFLNRSDKDGGLAFRGEGVSPVRVSAPATMLAKLQHGGLGGGLRLNKVDGKYDPDRDAALAIAEVGKGRAIGVFDRNLFWNAGEGTRLSHNDNREFTQRLVLWAAGRDGEQNVLQETNNDKKGLHNIPPKIEVSHQLAADGSYVDLEAIVKDDDQDGREPEIEWRMGKDQEGATFENNNPRAAKVRVFLEKPGTYSFQAFVRDGDYTLRKWLKVDVPTKKMQ